MSDSLPPQMLIDLGDYLKIKGEALSVRFEGYSERWEYSSWTYGEDNFIRATLTYRANYQGATWGESHIEERFDMAGFLRFAYERGAKAARPREG